MTRGEHVPTTAEERASIIADYQTGVGINRLRVKYRRGQARIVQVLDDAGISRIRDAASGEAKRGKPRLNLVQKNAGLGRQPTAPQWRYIAGIFDAEGYLGYSSRGKYFRLAIGQKDVRLLHWLLETLQAGRLAGLREQSGPHHDVGAFLIEAQRPIFEFCCGVLPYTIVKRVRVLEALTAFHTKYQWSASSISTSDSETMTPAEEQTQRGFPPCALAEPPARDQSG